MTDHEAAIKMGQKQEDNSEEEGSQMGNHSFDQQRRLSGLPQKQALSGPVNFQKSRHEGGEQIATSLWKELGC